MKVAIRGRDFPSLAPLILALVFISADAFSTFSNSRIPSAALLTGRPRSSSARATGSSYATGWPADNGHTDNYVTMIEDCTSFGRGERGLFVATTDHNYAIQSPALHHEQGWQSVTVNGEQVFVLTSWNRTFSTTLAALSEQQRDFIAEARANFTQNLAGLRLAHYTSGSSTSLASGAGSGSAGQRPSVAELVIAHMVKSSSAGAQQWAQFVSSSSSIPESARPQEYQQPQGSGATDSPPTPPTPPTPHQSQASQAQTFLEENALPPSAFHFFSDRRSFGANDTVGTAKKPPTATQQSQIESTKKTRPLARYAQAPLSPPPFIRGPNYNDQQAATTSVGGVDPMASKSLCSPARWLDSFNYYNLNAGSPLEKSLAGDVYFFDFYCNTLDVYSSSASVRQSLGMSAIYRDADFFSFSRSNLPSAINRIFLVDKHVFLIYNDGSLLVKANWMLDSHELDLIVQVRSKLKLIGAWQSRAANLVAS